MRSPAIHAKRSHMKRLLSNHNARSLKVISIRWRRRAIFLMGGVAVGAGGVALAVLGGWAQDALRFVLSKSRSISLLITPLGFALSVYLTNRFFPNSQGSGIPQAIAARNLTDQSARESLVSLRIAAGKIILTLF